MTTLQDLQALTDEQLIEAVATKVMGWESGPYADSGHLWWFDKNRAPNESFPERCRTIWNPLTDWDHTMEVVDRLTSEAFNFRSNIQKSSSYFSAEFYKPFGRGRPVVNEYWRKHDNYPCQQRVICLAAILAVSPTSSPSPR